VPSWRGARSSSAKAKGSPKAKSRSLEENDLASIIRVVLREADELCVSRIARFFDRRVVQSILRKAGDRAANLRVELPKGIDRRYSALVGRPQPLGFDSGVEAVMAIRTPRSVTVL
jgi:hypothetical protein